VWTQVRLADLPRAGTNRAALTLLSVANSPTRGWDWLHAGFKATTNTESKVSIMPPTSRGLLQRYLQEAATWAVPRCGTHRSPCCYRNYNSTTFRLLKAIRGGSQGNDPRPRPRGIAAAKASCA